MFNLGTNRKKDKEREKSISTPSIFAGTTKGTAGHKDVSSPVESVIKFSQGGGFVPSTPGGMPGSADDVPTVNEEDRIEIERRFEAFLVSNAWHARKMNRLSQTNIRGRWWDHYERSCLPYHLSGVLIEKTKQCANAQVLIVHHQMQLALPADKLAQMRSLPLEKKWSLLQSQKSKVSSSV